MFYQIKQNFSKSRTLKISSWDKSDDDQNPHRWLKYDKDPFLISAVLLKSFHQCWDSKRFLVFS